MKKTFIAVLSVLVLFFVFSCKKKSPTAPDVPAAPTATFSATPTITQTGTPPNTPTISPTPTITLSVTSSHTQTVTSSVTPTSTVTQTSTLTPTPQWVNAGGTALFGNSTSCSLAYHEGLVYAGFRSGDVADNDNIYVYKYLSGSNAFSLVGGAAVYEGASSAMLAGDPMGYYVYALVRTTTPSLIVKRFHRYYGTVWENVGSDVLSAYANSPAIDAYANSVYVAYSVPSDSNKIHVKKYGSSSWSDMGSPVYVTSGVKNLSIQADTAFAFITYTETDDNSLHVLKYNGTDTWVPIEESFASGAQYGSASHLYGSRLYVLYSGVSQGYKASVKVYDFGTWVDLGSPGFSADQAVGEYRSIFVENHSSVYVTFLEYNGGLYTAVVYHYDGASWSKVGPGYVTSGTGYFANVSAAEGKPYFMAVDGTDHNTYVKIYK